MKTFRKFSVLALAIPAFAIALSSCESKEEAASMQGGNFKVRMTDSPADFEALDVEIAEVEVYSETSGWVELSSESQFVDVLSLTNGSEAEIGFASGLEAGHYTQLRITFGNDNNLSVMAGADLGGLSSLLTLDLALQDSHQVVIEIDEQISSENSADILLDFNVAASVIQQGNDYILDPVMTEIHNAETGIQGEVEGAANAYIMVTDGQNSFSTYVDAQGRFLLRGMASGTYNLIAEARDEMGQMDPDPITLQNVTVVSGQFTQIGQIQF